MDEVKVYALGFKVPVEEAYTTRDGYIFWSVKDEDLSESIECCLDFYSVDSVMEYYRKNRYVMFDEYDTAVAIECRLKPKIVAKTII